MKTTLHTVLGGTGTIGSELIKYLKMNGKNVRSVSRTSNIPDVQNIRCDLLEKGSIHLALKESTHVYFCLMLPYDSKIWMQHWYNLVVSIVAFAKAENIRLIYLDNTYMYAKPYKGLVTEKFSQAMETKKGTARKRATDYIITAIKEEQLNAVIARSSDFYGPSAIHSQFYIKFIENIVQGKNPQTLIDPSIKHCYTYTVDVAKALYLLAMDDSSYGKVWHIPSSDPITLKEVNAICNAYLEKNYELSVMPIFIRKIVSLFHKEIREVDEMLYQFERDTVFDASRFKGRFPNFQPMEVKEGIKNMIASFDTN